MGRKKHAHTAVEPESNKVPQTFLSVTINKSQTGMPTVLVE